MKKDEKSLQFHVNAEKFEPSLFGNNLSQIKAEAAEFKPNLYPVSQNFNLNAADFIVNDVNRIKTSENSLRFTANEFTIKNSENPLRFDANEFKPELNPFANDFTMN